VMHPSSALADQFYRRLRALDATRRRVEQLFANGSVSRRDVERVYEALFLNAVALFEDFLETLFVGLLVDQQGLTSGHADVNPRATVRSYVVARELVMGGRKYLNWLPYSETKDRARVFFTGGRPFMSLSQDLEEHLSTCCYIRNAIAHRSQHATDMFLEKVVGSKALAPRERKPAGYLRSIHIALPPPPFSRYEHHVGEVLRAARFLAA